VGNRKAGSSDVPLLLEMNEKQYKLCSSKSIYVENKKKQLLIMNSSRFSID